MGIANFESLTVSMQKQAVHGLTFLAGYRWSKCMDESEEAFFDADAYSTPNPRSDYGPCSFNVTGQFKGSFVWDLPQVKFGPAVVHHILDNWEVNGILMLQDGQPFSVLSGVDNSTSGIGMDRADQIGNPSLPKHRSHAQEAREFFNTAAFRENAPGTYGETPRDYLSGPGYEDFDFSVVRAFRLPLGRKESQTLQFRAESFNLANRVNFANPTATVSSKAYGTISTADTPRILQFALKYQF
ncbi:MAG TPA: hypothetical protein VGR96_06215 [Acidobacteriaceae bacterium]|nr:hypothetical protein [Acidobacteriaceae bacterium]